MKWTAAEREEVLLVAVPPRSEVCGPLDFLLSRRAISSPCHYYKSKSVFCVVLQ